MTDAEISRYSEALHNEAPHDANTGAPPPNGAAPNGHPPTNYANSIVPPGGILGAARPLLLPGIVAGAAYHLSDGNLWWTAGLGLATLVLQGNMAPAPAAPANPYAAYAPR